MSLSNRVVCETRSFKLAFQNDASVNIKEINDEILDSVSKYAIKAVLGYTKKGRAVTFEELARNGITEDLADAESEVVKVLTFDFKDEKLFVMDKQSVIPLSRLKMTVGYRLGEDRAPETVPGEKPLDPEDDDYTADVFVKTKEA
ncbi:MAG: hypothetical protein JWP91_4122 [Fibrobacteres bacterium]|nr:hypothetical protein [Fibrobacterota bacterium]